MKSRRIIEAFGRFTPGAGRSSIRIAAAPFFRALCWGAIFVPVRSGVTI
jgi:hypothetical protein